MICSSEIGLSKEGGGVRVFARSRTAVSGGWGMDLSISWVVCGLWGVSS